MNARSELFRVIDAQVRKPVVAQIGGFRPEPGLRSWFGGGFHLPASHPWPEAESGPMIPVLQIVTSELPLVPSELAEVDVLQVFMSERLPVGTPALPGPAFAIYAFRGIPLEPRAQPKPYAFPRPFQIRWTVGRPEGPSWEDAFGFVPHELIEEFVKDEDCFDAYYDRYAPTHSTKVGGWPSYIQGAPSQLGSFAFQIDSEEKPGWMVGDNGTMYFFRNGGEWSLHWDCY